MDFIESLKNETRDFLFSLISQNKIDTSLMTVDAAWYVNGQRLGLEGGEIDNFLNHTKLNVPKDEPNMIYTDASSVGEECIIIAGRSEYHDRVRPSIFVMFDFTVVWQLAEEHWKINKLFTMRERRDTTENVVSLGNESLNDAKLLQSFPTGLICCTDEETLPIRRMNGKVFNLLGYTSMTDFIHCSGNWLMSSVHPDDLPGFQKYISSLKNGGEDESVCIRLRKKDYEYVSVQLFGSHFDKSWLIFSCVDYTDQQERIDNLRIKSQNLAEIRDYYRVLISNLPTGFYRCTLNSSLDLQFASDSIYEMTGYTKSDIFGDMNASYREMILPEDRKKVAEIIASLMQYPHTEQMIYRIRKRNGKVIQVLDRMRSVRSADGAMEGYSIVVDLEGQFVHDVPDESPAPETDNYPTTTYGHVVEIRTFGYFEVLVDKKPIAFRSAKVRELLAVLIDRGGNFVTRENIVRILWENETVNQTTLARTRKTYMNLNTELKAYGIEDIIESENGQRRIIPEKIKCDLYDYQNDVPGARKQFKGEYMTDYSWSETTLSALLADYK